MSPCVHSQWRIYLFTKKHQCLSQTSSWTSVKQYEVTAKHRCVSTTIPGRHASSVLKCDRTLQKDVVNQSQGHLGSQNTSIPEELKRFNQKIDNSTTHAHPPNLHHLPLRQTQVPSKFGLHAGCRQGHIRLNLLSTCPMGNSSTRFGFGQQKTARGRFFYWAGNTQFDSYLGFTAALLSPNISNYTLWLHYYQTTIKSPVSREPPFNHV